MLLITLLTIYIKKKISAMEIFNRPNILYVTQFNTTIYCGLAEKMGFGPMRPVTDLTP